MQRHSATTANSPSIGERSEELSDLYRKDHPARELTQLILLKMNSVSTRKLWLSPESTAARDSALRVAINRVPAHMQTVFVAAGFDAFPCNEMNYLTLRQSYPDCDSSFAYRFNNAEIEAFEPHVT